MRKQKTIRTKHGAPSPRAPLNFRRLRPAQLPAYVRACSSRGNTPGRLTWVWTWKKGDPSTPTRERYVCHSVRCEHCRKAQASP